jgi:hypothetical protein
MSWIRPKTCGAKMFWSYGLAVRNFEPQYVFILGNLFDDGINYNQKQFDKLYKKLNNVFSCKLANFIWKIQVDQSSICYVIWFIHFPDDRDKLNSETTRKAGQPVIIAINGNHDIGWHYEMTSNLKHRFDDKFNTKSVVDLDINGNHFVAINSVTMEGDFCQLCSEADSELRSIAHKICPKKSGQQHTCHSHALPTL